LEHVAAAIPPGPDVVYLDEPRDNWRLWLANHELVVFTTVKPCSRPHLLDLELAPWCHDDLIEYLATTCRDRCADVVRRVDAAPGSDRDALVGRPALWQVVLDEFVADPLLREIPEALRRRVEREI